MDFDKYCNFTQQRAGDFESPALHFANILDLQASGPIKAPTLVYELKILCGCYFVQSAGISVSLIDIGIFIVTCPPPVSGELARVKEP